MQTLKVGQIFLSNSGFWMKIIKVTPKKVIAAYEPFGKDNDSSLNFYDERFIKWIAPEGFTLEEAKLYFAL